MIQKLIQKIIILLQESLAGIISNPANHIVAGPIGPLAANKLPMMAIYQDKLELSQNAKETSSSQPRPQELRQEIAVNVSHPAGPYSLNKTPLEKSTLCSIIYNKGTVTEKKILLVETKDFMIDYQNKTILFQYDISGASLIVLTYSFVGVFTVREFHQEFLVDIYDNTIANIEKWSSLTTGIILTNHNELIEYYNIKDKTEYGANNFLTLHTINQLHLLDGTSDRSGTISKFQLKFKIVGQMKLVKEIVGGYGLIEKIHSPGKIAVQPVDIEIEIE